MSLVMFFFGVLVSTATIQLYVVRRGEGGGEAGAAKPVALASASRAGLPLQGLRALPSSMHQSAPVTFAHTHAPPTASVPMPACLPACLPARLPACCQVGVIFSVLLAIIFHPWTWNVFMPSSYQYFLAILAVIVINKVGRPARPCAALPCTALPRAALGRCTATGGATRCHAIPSHPIHRVLPPARTQHAAARLLPLVQAKGRGTHAAARGYRAPALLYAHMLSTRM